MMETAFSLFPLAHFCKSNAPNGTKAINIQMLLSSDLQELSAVDTVMLLLLLKVVAIVILEVMVMVMLVMLVVI